MLVQLLSAAERDRANRFPSAITDEDLITFFMLSEEDRKQIPVHAGPHAHLGLALELCALRFMGFVPEDLASAPPDAVTCVARQLAVGPGVLARYTGSAYTRMHHRQTIQAYLGYRRTRREDMERLAAWLLERALEHDSPTLPYALACEQLQRERLVRPGVTQLGRLVAETRQSAQAETFRRLGSILTEACQRILDTILAVEPTRGMTLLAWLRRPASPTPRAPFWATWRNSRSYGPQGWSTGRPTPSTPTASSSWCISPASRAPKPSNGPQPHTAIPSS